MGLDYVDGCKNIVMMGGSYGGLRTARVLAEQLADQLDYRIIVIDKNSHMNHLYVLPRFSILPEHEPKAFIPYTRIFKEGEHRHAIVQATILSMTQNSVTVLYPNPSSVAASSPSSHTVLHGGWQQTIPFEFAVYALGAALPDPINVWKSLEIPDSQVTPGSLTGQVKHQTAPDGTKDSSVSWLKSAQGRIQDSESVIVVGGGALGIQIASDIAAVYPLKRVSLLHSRERLLPIYDPQVHDLVMEFLSRLNVSVILNSRLSWDSMQRDERDERNRRILKTVSGREYRADAVFLCTGSKPNVDILSRGLGSRCLNPINGLVKVRRSLQLNATQATLEESAEPEGGQEKPPFPHIFAIGDTADAFGAIKAGHTAYFQGEVAARNIVSLITQGEEAALEQYVPGLPMIKVSVGLRQCVTQSQSSVLASEDGKDDLGAELMWRMLGHEIREEADYHL